LSESINGESPDFSRPLAALKTCHASIRARCDALRALVDRMKEHGPDGDAQRMAADIVRYFDTAARFHHEDEEDDLLPRMIVVSTINRGSSLTRLVASIATEHREMERAWTQLRALLQGLAAGEPDLDPLLVDHFVKLYGVHIAVEEANLYPLAEMLLSRGDLAAISASMVERRGQP
jgi:hemerythrin-like domain-containing protein